MNRMSSHVTDMLGIIYFQFLDLFSLSYKISCSIIFLLSDIFKSCNDLCKIHAMVTEYFLSASELH